MKNKLQKMSPTSSQVHVDSPGEEEKITIKTKSGHMVEIGNGKPLKKDALTSEGRSHVADHNFALPETRQFPINDLSHARNALSRVSANGTGDQKAKVRAAVYRKYPSLRPVSKSDGPRRVASVAVQHGNHILMGKRRDNGKWTTPGGHLEADEDFPTGAMRELLEETGIQAQLEEIKQLSEVHKLKDKEGKDLHVQPFRVKLSERPQTSMMTDPDKEVHRWQWVDVSQGLPKDIAMNMHTPPERNCLMKSLGLSPARPSEADSSDQMYPQLDNLESEMLKAVGYEISKGGPGSGPQGGGSGKTDAEHEATTKATAAHAKKTQASLNRATNAHDDNPTPANAAKRDRAAQSHVAATTAHESAIRAHLDHMKAQLASMGVHKEDYTDQDGDQRFEDDDSNAGQDSNNLDQMYSYQLLVEGMDWELEHTTTDPDQAKKSAMEMLEEDPSHYRKLNMNQDGTDDVLAKDLNENDQNPWEPGGLHIDLGSGQTRESGHIGFDTYPYDHGTVVHDLDMGIPVPDGSCERVRLGNVDMEDDNQKALLSEVHRVLMPGGQFTYEGPNDIYNDQSWAKDYPGLVLTDHESNVTKEGPGSNVHRQTFTRVATPDPATANDAEPRIGVAAYDWLPEDALIAADAMGYYNSDATSSGTGNRLHGYASQGAMFDRTQQDSGRSPGPARNLAKFSDSSGSGDSNQKVKRLRFVKDSTAAQEDDSATHDMPNQVTPAEEDVDAAFNQTNPNPAAPKKLKRNVSKIEKILKSERIIPIFKANPSKQIVYAVVLAPNEIDSQDDYMEPDEIEKAAHRYLANSRVVGSGHSKPIKAHPVESFIAPQDFTVEGGQYGDQEVKKGSWVLGVKIDDPDEWQKVVNGEYQGFSVGGVGKRDHV